MGLDEIATSVVDTTPPAMNLSVRPEILWPPSGGLTPVSAVVTAEDLCSDVEVLLGSITSSDPIAPALPRGRRAGPDIHGAGLGSADFNFELRAERPGPDTGRVYTITYFAADASGNISTSSSFVTVPHDRRKTPPSASAP
jgi:hypothetical protein